MEKHLETSLNSPEQRRNRILGRFQNGPLGRWLLSLGFALTLNANGCLTRTIQLPEIPGHTAAGLEARQAAINRVLGRETPLLNIRADRLPPEAPPRLPEVRGFRELAGYEDTTIIELLRTYPSFMIDSRNTSVVRFGEETHDYSPEYGPEFQNLHAGAYATYSDPEHPSEIVITRDILSRGNSPEAQTEALNTAVSHELAHPVDPQQEFYTAGTERLNAFYELLQISSTPEWRVPFEYSTRIRNRDPRLQAIYTAIEYHAQALEAATTVEVEEGENWTTCLTEHFSTTYSIPTWQARRTAIYAVNYIARRDPNYDPVQSYIRRQDIIRRLTEQRRANRAQTDPVLRTRPFSSTEARRAESEAIERTQREVLYRRQMDQFIDRRLQELREWNDQRIRNGNFFSLSHDELIQRIESRLTGHMEQERSRLTFILGQEAADRVMRLFNQADHMNNFLDYRLSHFTLPELVPSELRQGRKLDTVLEWGAYIRMIRLRCLLIMGLSAVGPQDEITGYINGHWRELERLYRTSGIATSPRDRQIFQTWAEQYLVDRLHGPAIREVPSH